MQQPASNAQARSRADMDPARECFVLGEWQVDAAANRLQRGSDLRPLRHKAMALLVLLAQRQGETVSRDEIVQAVWDGNHLVAAKAINTAVWAIRQALGDDPDSPRYLETIAKKGYRLIAVVQPVADAPPTLPQDGPVSPLPAALPADRPGNPSAGLQQPGTSGPRPYQAALAAAMLLVAVAVLAAWVTAGWSPWERLRATMGRGATSALPSATPLTQLPGHEYLGQVSPDGRWLAFAWWQGHGVGRLHLREAGNPAATPRLVSGDTGDVHGVAWSPDSRAVVFTATAAHGRCSVWRLALENGSLQALARCAALWTPMVDWSPDGRWIAFTGEAEGVGGLFLVAPDGSGLRRLTSSPPAALPDHQPAWSPDSLRLAFARQDPADGSRDLYETTLDGRVQRLSSLRLQFLHGLTFDAGGEDLVLSTTRQDARVLMRWERHAGRAVPLGLEGSAPARSADGSLVYALMRSHVSIARLAWDGTAPQRMISSVATDRAPDVHAASGRTVFISRRSGAPELWLANTPGDPPRMLTRLGGQVATPAWSPRGDSVAFVGSCGPGGRTGLCRLDPSNGAMRVLAADAASYGRPAWHPTAAEVWVASDRGGRWQLWRFPLADGEPPSTLDTEVPAGRALAWAGDGSALLYQPHLGQGELRWRPLAGGRERRLQASPPGETLLDWRLATDGVVVLSRGLRERFSRLALDGSPSVTLADLALGSFPELASFTLTGDGGVQVEVSNTAFADLMQAR